MLVHTHRCTAKAGRGGRCVLNVYLAPLRNENAIRAQQRLYPPVGHKKTLLAEAERKRNVAERKQNVAGADHRWGIRFVSTGGA